MPFDWLDDFHRHMAKSDDYAEKTLAAYRLGMRARGSIAGVAVERDAGSCPASKQLPEDAVYHPDEAPHLPLPDCTHPDRCGCVYRPVMTYQLENPEESAGEST